MSQQHTSRPPEHPKPSNVNSNAALNRLKNRLIVGWHKDRSEAALSGFADDRAAHHLTGGFGERQFDVGDGIDGAASQTRYGPESGFWSQSNVDGNSVLGDRSYGAPKFGLSSFGTAGQGFGGSIANKSISDRKRGAESSLNDSTVGGGGGGASTGTSLVNKVGAMSSTVRHRSHLGMSTMARSQGLEAVAHSFAHGEVEFCYVDPDRNDHYKFALRDDVPAGISKSGCVTLSKNGVLRSVIDESGNLTVNEFTTHRDLMREQHIYHELRKIPVFGKYRKWKSFAMWRLFITQKKFGFATSQLNQKLCFLEPDYRNLILGIKRIVEDFEKLPVLKIKDLTVYEIHDFIAMQKQVRETNSGLRAAIFDELISLVCKESEVLAYKALVNAPTVMSVDAYNALKLTPAVQPRVLRDRQDEHNSFVKSHISTLSVQRWKPAAEVAAAARKAKRRKGQTGSYSHDGDDDDDGVDDEWDGGKSGGVSYGLSFTVADILESAGAGSETGIRDPSEAAGSDEVVRVVPGKSVNFSASSPADGGDQRTVGETKELGLKSKEERIGAVIGSSLDEDSVASNFLPAIRNPVESGSGVISGFRTHQTRPQQLGAKGDKMGSEAAETAVIMRGEPSLLSSTVRPTPSKGVMAGGAHGADSSTVASYTSITHAGSSVATLSTGNESENEAKMKMKMAAMSVGTVGMMDVDSPYVSYTERSAIRIHCRRLAVFFRLVDFIVRDALYNSVEAGMKVLHMYLSRPSLHREKQQQNLLRLQQQAAGSNSGGSSGGSSNSDAPSIIRMVHSTALFKLSVQMTMQASLTGGSAESGSSIEGTAFNGASRFSLRQSFFGGTRVSGVMGSAKTSSFVINSSWSEDAAKRPPLVLDPTQRYIIVFVPMKEDILETFLDMLHDCLNTGKHTESLAADPRCLALLKPIETDPKNHLIEDRIYIDVGNSVNTLKLSCCQILEEDYMQSVEQSFEYNFMCLSYAHYQELQLRAESSAAVGGSGGGVVDAISNDRHTASSSVALSVSVSGIAVDEVEEHLTQFNLDIARCEEVEDLQDVGVFRVDYSELKQTVLTQIRKTKDYFWKMIPEQYVLQGDRLYIELSRITSVLSSSFATLEEFTAVVEAFNAATADAERFSGMFTAVSTIREIIDTYDMPKTDAVQRQNITLTQLWHRYSQLLSDFESAIDENIKHYQGEIKQRTHDLVKPIAMAREYLASEVIANPDSDSERVLIKLNVLLRQIHEVRDRGVALEKHQDILNVFIYNRVIPIEMIEDINSNISLWTVIKSLKELEVGFMAVNFLDAASEDVEKQLRSCSTILQRGLGVAQSSVKLQKWLQHALSELSVIAPLVRKLQSHTLKDRHVHRIHEILSRKIFDEGDITVGELVDVSNVKDFADPIDEVYQESLLQHNLEMRINECSKIVHTMEFQFEMDSENKTLVFISNFQKVLEDLEDIRITILSCLQSKHANPHRDQFEALCTQVESWLELSRSMKFLQASYLRIRVLFTSVRTARYLNQSLKYFKHMDEIWRVMIKSARADKKLARIYDRPGLTEELASAIFDIHNTDQNLRVCVEEQCRKWPKLYIMELDDVISVFGTQDPKRTLQKCTVLFPFATDVHFNLLEPFSTRAIQSNEETFTFIKECSARNSLVDWLRAIDSSLSDKMSIEIATFATKSTQLLEDFRVPTACQQSRITALQIQFWDVVMNSLSRNPRRKGLLPQVQEIRDQMSMFTSLLTNRSVVYQFKCISGLITVLLYHRDVLESLTADGDLPSSEPSFLLDCALKKTWDPVSNSIVVRQSHLKIPYGMKYTGFTERMVITPLTDRCFLAINSALHHDMGAFPVLQGSDTSGGKRSTLNALAAELGFEISHVSCAAEVRSADRMFNVLKACVSSGLWVNFNNLEVLSSTLLSILLTSLSAVHVAVASRAKHLYLGGSTVETVSGEKSYSAISTVHRPRVTLIYNTALRGEATNALFLPASVRQQFRPIQMIVPARVAVLRVLLAACGFANVPVTAVRLDALCVYLVTNNVITDPKLLTIVLYRTIHRIGKKAENATLQPATQISNLVKKLIFGLPEHIQESISEFDLRFICNLFLEIVYTSQLDLKEFKALTLPADCRFQLQQYLMHLPNTSIFVVGPVECGKTTMIKAAIASAITEHNAKLDMLAISRSGSADPTIGSSFISNQKRGSGDFVANPKMSAFNINPLSQRQSSKDEGVLDGGSVEELESSIINPFVFAEYTAPDRADPSFASGGCVTHTLELALAAEDTMLELLQTIDPQGPVRVLHIDTQSSLQLSSLVPWTQHYIRSGGRRARCVYESPDLAHIDPQLAASTPIVFVRGPDFSLEDSLNGHIERLAARIGRELRSVLVEAKSWIIVPCIQHFGRHGKILRAIYSSDLALLRNLFTMIDSVYANSGMQTVIGTNKWNEDSVRRIIVFACIWTFGVTGPHSRKPFDKWFKDRFEVSMDTSVNDAASSGGDSQQNLSGMGADVAAAASAAAAVVGGGTGRGGGARQRRNSVMANVAAAGAAGGASVGSSGIGGNSVLHGLFVRGVFPDMSSETVFRSVLYHPRIHSTALDWITFQRVLQTDLQMNELASVGEGDTGGGKAESEEEVFLIKSLRASSGFGQLDYSPLSLYYATALAPQEFGFASLLIPTPTSIAFSSIQEAILAYPPEEKGCVNVLVTGDVGSGKSSLLDALIRHSKTVPGTSRAVLGGTNLLAASGNQRNSTETAGSLPASFKGQSPANMGYLRWVCRIVKDCGPVELFGHMHRCRQLMSSQLMELHLPRDVGTIVIEDVNITEHFDNHTTAAESIRALSETERLYNYKRNIWQSMHKKLYTLLSSQNHSIPSAYSATQNGAAGGARGGRSSELGGGVGNESRLNRRLLRHTVVLCCDFVELTNVFAIKLWRSCPQIKEEVVVDLASITTHMVQRAQELFKHFDVMRRSDAVADIGNGVEMAGNDGSIVAGVVGSRGPASRSRGTQVIGAMGSSAPVAGSSGGRQTQMRGTGTTAVSVENRETLQLMREEEALQRQVHQWQIHYDRWMKDAEESLCWNYTARSPSSLVDSIFSTVREALHSMTVFTTNDVVRVWDRVVSDISHRTIVPKTVSGFGSRLGTGHNNPQAVAAVVGIEEMVMLPAQEYARTQFQYDFPAFSTIIDREKQMRLSARETYALQAYASAVSIADGGSNKGEQDPVVASSSSSVSGADRSSSIASELRIDGFPVSFTKHTSGFFKSGANSHAVLNTTEFIRDTYMQRFGETNSTAAISTGAGRLSDSFSFWNDVQACLARITTQSLTGEVLLNAFTGQSPAVVDTLVRVSCQYAHFQSRHVHLDPSLFENVDDHLSARSITGTDRDNNVGAVATGGSVGSAGSVNNGKRKRADKRNRASETIRSHFTLLVLKQFFNDPHTLKRLRTLVEELEAAATLSTTEEDILPLETGSSLPSQLAHQPLQQHRVLRVSSSVDDEGGGAVPSREWEKMDPRKSRHQQQIQRKREEDARKEKLRRSKEERESMQLMPWEFEVVQNCRSLLTARAVLTHNGIRPRTDDDALGSTTPGASSRFDTGGIPTGDDRSSRFQGVRSADNHPFDNTSLHARPQTYVWHLQISRDFAVMHGAWQFLHETIEMKNDLFGQYLRDIWPEFRLEVVMGLRAIMAEFVLRQRVILSFDSREFQMQALRGTASVVGGESLHSRLPSLVHVLPLYPDYSPSEPEIVRLCGKELASAIRSVIEAYLGMLNDRLSSGNSDVLSIMTGQSPAEAHDLRRDEHPNHTSQSPNHDQQQEQHGRQRGKQGTNRRSYAKQGQRRSHCNASIVDETIALALRLYNVAKGKGDMWKVTLMEAYVFLQAFHVHPNSSRDRNEHHKSSKQQYEFAGKQRQQNEVGAGLGSMGMLPHSLKAFRQASNALPAENLQSSFSASREEGQEREAAAEVSRTDSQGIDLRSNSGDPSLSNYPHSPGSTEGVLGVERRAPIVPSTVDRALLADSLFTAIYCKFFSVFLPTTDLDSTHLKKHNLVGLLHTLKQRMRLKLTCMEAALQSRKHKKTAPSQSRAQEDSTGIVGAARHGLHDHGKVTSAELDAFPLAMAYTLWKLSDTKSSKFGHPDTVQRMESVLSIAGALPQEHCLLQGMLSVVFISLCLEEKIRIVDKTCIGVFMLKGIFGFTNVEDITSQFAATLINPSDATVVEFSACTIDSALGNSPKNSLGRSIPAVHNTNSSSGGGGRGAGGGSHRNGGDRVGSFSPRKAPMSRGSGAARYASGIASRNSLASLHSREDNRVNADAKAEECDAEGEDYFIEDDEDDDDDDDFEDDIESLSVLGLSCQCLCDELRQRKVRRMMERRAASTQRKASTIPAAPTAAPIGDQVDSHAVEEKSIVESHEKFAAAKSADDAEAQVQETEEDQDEDGDTFDAANVAATKSPRALAKTEGHGNFEEKVDDGDDESIDAGVPVLCSRCYHARMGEHSTVTLLITPLSSLISDLMLVYLWKLQILRMPVLLTPLNDLTSTHADYIAQEVDLAAPLFMQRHRSPSSLRPNPTADSGNENIIASPKLNANYVANQAGGDAGAIKLRDNERDIERRQSVASEGWLSVFNELEGAILDDIQEDPHVKQFGAFWKETSDALGRPLGTLSALLGSSRSLLGGSGSGIVGGGGGGGTSESSTLMLALWSEFIRILTAYLASFAVVVSPRTPSRDERTPNIDKLISHSVLLLSERLESYFGECDIYAVLLNTLLKLYFDASSVSGMTAIQKILAQIILVKAEANGIVVQEKKQGHRNQLGGDFSGTVAGFSSYIGEEDDEESSDDEDARGGAEDTFLLTDQSRQLLENCLHVAGEAIESRTQRQTVVAQYCTPRSPSSDTLHPLHALAATGQISEIPPKVASSTSSTSVVATGGTPKSDALTTTEALDTAARADGEAKENEIAASLQLGHYRNESILHSIDTHVLDWVNWAASLPECISTSAYTFHPFGSSGAAAVAASNGGKFQRGGAGGEGEGGGSGRGAGAAVSTEDLNMPPCDGYEPNWLERVLVAIALKPMIFPRLLRQAIVEISGLAKHDKVTGLDIAERESRLVRPLEPNAKTVQVYNPSGSVNTLAYQLIKGSEAPHGGSPGNSFSNSEDFPVEPTPLMSPLRQRSFKIAQAMATAKESGVVGTLSRVVSGGGAGGEGGIDGSGAGVDGNSMQQPAIHFFCSVEALREHCHAIDIASSVNAHISAAAAASAASVFGRTGHDILSQAIENGVVHARYRTNLLKRKMVIAGPLSAQNSVALLGAAGMSAPATSLSLSRSLDATDKHTLGAGTSTNVMGEDGTAVAGTVSRSGTQGAGSMSIAGGGHMLNLRVDTTAAEVGGGRSSKFGGLNMGGPPAVGSGLSTPAVAALTAALYTYSNPVVHVVAIGGDSTDTSLRSRRSALLRSTPTSSVSDSEVSGGKVTNGRSNNRLGGSRGFMAGAQPFLHNYAPVVLEIAGALNSESTSSSLSTGPAQSKFTYLVETSELYLSTYVATPGISTANKRNSVQMMLHRADSVRAPVRRMKSGRDRGAMGADGMLVEKDDAEEDEEDVESGISPLSSPVPLGFHRIRRTLQSKRLSVSIAKSRSGRSLSFARSGGTGSGSPRNALNNSRGLLSKYGTSGLRIVGGSAGRGVGAGDIGKGYTNFNSNNESGGGDAAEAMFIDLPNAAHLPFNTIEEDPVGSASGELKSFSPSTFRLPSSTAAASSSSVDASSVSRLYALSGMKKPTPESFDEKAISLSPFDTTYDVLLLFFVTNVRTWPMRSHAVFHPIVLRIRWLLVLFHTAAEHKLQQSEWIGSSRGTQYRSYSIGIDTLHNAVQLVDALFALEAEKLRSSDTESNSSSIISNSISPDVLAEYVSDGIYCAAVLDGQLKSSVKSLFLSFFLPGSCDVRTQYVIQGTLQIPSDMKDSSIRRFILSVRAAFKGEVAAVTALDMVGSTVALANSSALSKIYSAVDTIQRSYKQLLASAVLKDGDDIGYKTAESGPRNTGDGRTHTGTASSVAPAIHAGLGQALKGGAQSLVAGTPTGLLSHSIPRHSLDLFETSRYSTVLRALTDGQQSLTSRVLQTVQSVLGKGGIPEKIKTETKEVAQRMNEHVMGAMLGGGSGSGSSGAAMGGAGAGGKGVQGRVGMGAGAAPSAPGGQQPGSASPRTGRSYNRRAGKVGLIRLASREFDPLWAYLLSECYEFNKTVTTIRRNFTTLLHALGTAAPSRSGPGVAGSGGKPTASISAGNAWMSNGKGFLQFLTEQCDGKVALNGQRIDYAYYLSIFEALADGLVPLSWLQHSHLASSVGLIGATAGTGGGGSGGGACGAVRIKLTDWLGQLSERRALLNNWLNRGYPGGIKVHLLANPSGLFYAARELYAIKTGGSANQAQLEKISFQYTLMDAQSLSLNDIQYLTTLNHGCNFILRDVYLYNAVFSESNGSIEFLPECSASCFGKKLSLQLTLSLDDRDERGDEYLCPLIVRSELPSARDLWARHPPQNALISQQYHDVAPQASDLGGGEGSASDVTGGRRRSSAIRGGGSPAGGHPGAPSRGSSTRGDLMRHKSISSATNPGSIFGALGGVNGGDALFSAVGTSAPLLQIPLSTTEDTDDCRLRAVALYSCPKWNRPI